MNDLVVQLWCCSALVCLIKSSVDIYGRTVGNDLAFGSVDHCSKKIEPFFSEETFNGRGGYWH